MAHVPLVLKIFWTVFKNDEILDLMILFMLKVQLMPELKHWRTKNLILEKRFYSMMCRNCGAVTYCDNVMYQSSDRIGLLNVFLQHI